MHLISPEKIFRGSGAWHKALPEIKKVTNIKQKSFLLSCIGLIIEFYLKNITKNFDYKKMLVQIGPAL